MTIISKQDTNKIAKHLAIVQSIIFKLEEKYDTDICFNKNASLFCADILHTAGNIERIWNNTI